MESLKVESEVPIINLDDNETLDTSIKLVTTSKNSTDCTIVDTNISNTLDQSCLNDDKINLVKDEDDDDCSIILTAEEKCVEFLHKIVSQVNIIPPNKVGLIESKSNEIQSTESSKDALKDNDCTLTLIAVAQNVQKADQVNAIHKQADESLPKIKPIGPAIENTNDSRCSVANAKSKAIANKVEKTSKTVNTVNINENGDDCTIIDSDSETTNETEIKKVADKVIEQTVEHLPKPSARISIIENTNNSYCKIINAVSEASIINNTEDEQRTVNTIDINDRDDDCTMVPLYSDVTQHSKSRTNVKDKSCSSEKVQNKAPVIVVEDHDDNDCTIVGTSKPTNSHQNNVVIGFEALFKENRILAELIEKCLDLENSTGMLRIINRTLIPIYENTDEAYLKSNRFESTLTRTIVSLEVNPNRKFSHLKALCETMKSFPKKKKVALETLSTTTEHAASLKRKISPKKKKIRKIKKSKIIIVDEDSDTDVEMGDASVTKSSSNLQTNRFNNVDKDLHIKGVNNGTPVINNTIQNTNQHVILIDDDKHLCNKENRTDITNSNQILIDQSEERLLLFSISPDISTNNSNKAEIPTSDQNKKILNVNNNITEIDLSNEPDDVENSNNTSDLMECTNSKRVDFLEKQIAYYVTAIQELEEKEVNDDSISSPYLLSESFKAKVLELYNEICYITGSEPIKRHTVRMKTEDHQHKGPVQFFEEFINNSIDEFGNPEFPDLHDVVECVHKANAKFDLRLTKAQVDDEARSLFIHYGRKIQKHRQKREWRHLLRYVKVEAPDPADEDPELQAKLQANYTRARRKEKELLERYVEMEKAGVSPDTQDIRLNIDNENSDLETSNTVPNLPSTSNCNISGLNTYQECLLGVKDNIYIPVYVPIYNPWSLQQITLVQTPMSPVNAENFQGVQNNVQSSVIPDSRYIQNNLVSSTEDMNNQPHLQSTEKLDSSNEPRFLNGEPHSENAQIEIEINIPKVEKTESDLQSAVPRSKNNEIEIEIDFPKLDNTSTHLESNEVCSEKTDLQSDTIVPKLEVTDVTIEHMVDKLKNTEPHSENVKYNQTDKTASGIYIERSKPCLENTKPHLEITTPNLENVKSYPDIMSDTNVKINQENPITDKTKNMESNTSSEPNCAKSKSQVETITPLLPSDGKSKENKHNSYPVMPIKIESCISVRSEYRDVQSTDSKNLPVKMEQLDIPKMLEQLGDNYTATIIDIEDPFMVIDISDSSDSEDDVR